MKTLIIIVVFMVAVGVCQAQELGITRIEAVRMVMDHYGLTPKMVQEIRGAVFGDVCSRVPEMVDQFNPEAKWYVQQLLCLKIQQAIVDCAYAEEMYRLGITAGCGDRGGSPAFCPDDPAPTWMIDVFIRQAEKVVTSRH